MMVGTEEDPELKKVLAFLLKAKGFDARQYKRNYIKRRLAVRMRAVGALGYSDYLRVLHSDRQECGHLLDRLTIHVTEFFRDPEVFQALRDKVLPEFSAKKNHGIRVWSAGCSTGEEAYSAAMMLREWQETRQEFSFEILATDIDPGSVRKAEQGEYPVESIGKVSKDRVEKWFRVSGAKVRVSQDIRRLVRFRAHDLLGGWYAGMAGFHLIFCRNMLIYLTASQQQRLYEQFAEALAPGGYLVLGLTETLLGPARRFFHCVDVRHRIYAVNEKPGDVENQMGKERKSG